MTSSRISIGPALTFDCTLTPASDWLWLYRNPPLFTLVVVFIVELLRLICSVGTGERGTPLGARVRWRDI